MKGLQVTLLNRPDGANRKEKPTGRYGGRLHPSLKMHRARRSGGCGMDHPGLLLLRGGLKRTEEKTCQKNLTCTYEY